MQYLQGRQENHRKVAEGFTGEYISLIGGRIIHISFLFQVMKDCLFAVEELVSRQIEICLCKAYKHNGPLNSQNYIWWDQDDVGALWW